MHTFMVNRPSSPPKCTLRSKCAYNSHLFEGFKIQKYQINVHYNEQQIFGFFALFYRLNLRKKINILVVRGQISTTLEVKKVENSPLLQPKLEGKFAFFWGGGQYSLEVKKVENSPLQQAQLEGKFTFWVFGGGNCINPKKKKLYQNNFEFTMTKKTLYLTEIL